MPDEFDEWIDRVCEADPLPDDVGDDDDSIVRGPPLTSEEIDFAKDRLAKWQSARSFNDDVLGLCHRCKSSDYFLQPRLKFLHDAFVLAEFAIKRGVDQVRLAARNENWPDGRVKIQTRTFNIEVTSTHGGRKLGEEYRRMSGAEIVVEHDPVEDWVTRAESIPRYLDGAIRDKVERKYSSPCWLVVYLNISERDIRHEHVKQVIAGTIFRYRDQFENISVLWKRGLYSSS